MSFHLETERLVLRHFALSDSAFILELLNEPSFIENIRDAGVRDIEGAKNYLRTIPIKSYEDFGFGLFHVAYKDTYEPIGMCGLIKRPTLPHVDIGFAFLSRVFGKGYATESAFAVRDLAFKQFNMPRLIGITTMNNIGSINVLKKLGMKEEGTVQLSPATEDLMLFGMDKNF